jgi:phosphoglycerate kinase
MLDKLNLSKEINHISTGGGAMLAFISGEEMPGLLALEELK